MSEQQLSMQSGDVIRIANRLFSRGDYGGALALYQRAQALYPELRDSLYLNIEISKKRLPAEEPVATQAVSAPSAENQWPTGVFVGIAAIPEREEALRQVIDSLIDQVPKIGVYLNGWKKIPSFLKNDKIEIAGFGGRDLGDVGKFYWVEKHDGVYFTCDDDLVYPEDYVDRTLRKLQVYNFKAAVGWHGSLIKQPFQNYYDKDSRRVFVFSAHRPYDTPVHILGTGCCAFHTRALDIHLQDFLYPNMADIFFSLRAQEKKIPFFVIAHEKDEIREVQGSKESSIFSHSSADVISAKNTREIQNEFVRNHPVWTTNDHVPLSVMVIGRFENYSKGGIYKSCHLIKDSLTALGHKVTVLDTQNDLTFGADRVDLCWIYPGDPARPDFSTVDVKIASLQAAGIPVLVNLSYLYEPERTKWIAERLKYYNRPGATPVLAAVFTESAAHDPLLAEVRDYVAVVPKTLQPNLSASIPSFSEREGICLGDATKLGNGKVIGGSINPWIDAIHRRLPHVNLYAYKQYQGQNPHSKVRYVPHMKGDFGEWLSRRRIFICANVHLTFEMVACEAQHVGTPTVYRHMPHSLSEYISATGLAVRNPEEMGEMVAWLYNNERSWSDLSQASINNAHSKNINLLSSSLEGYLRLAIFRARSLNKVI